MPVIDIDFTQLLVLQRRVPEIGRMTDDLRFAWDQVVPALKKEVEQTFDDEGPRWAPLAHSTQLERKRQGYGMAHPILVRDGSMKESLTKNPLVVSEPQFLWFGTTSKIAAYHQYGAKHKRGNWRLPSRPMLQAKRLIPVAKEAFMEAFVEEANRLWHEVTERGSLGGASRRVA